MSTKITNTQIGEQTSATFLSGAGLGTIGPSTSNLQTPSVKAGNGSTPGNFDRVAPFTISVVAGTPYTLNLRTGVDSNGNTLAMVHLGRIHAAHQGSTGSVVVGAGTHPAMGSDQSTLQPGGSCVFHNPLIGYQMSSGAVTGVSPVEALPVVDTSGAGAFNLSAAGITTGSITYSATIATLITNINAALDSAFGSGDLVASGASLAALVITGSSGNYQYNAFLGHFTSANISGSGFTINGKATGGVSTTTTAGLPALSGQQDTLTITADIGVVPVGLMGLGRSA